jgi:oxygen-dependent protoporphyrinogen oxidase
VETLATRLGADVRLGAVAEAVTLSAGGYVIRLADGDTVQAQAVLLATPAVVTAQLLRHAAADAAAVLSGIRYEGIGIVYLALHEDDMPQSLSGYGVLIPAGQRRHIDGVTWISSKWHERAPAGYVLLRVFVGGPYTRESLALDDEQLIQLVMRELSGMLGVTASPVMTRAYRWSDGYPQYDVGHLDRVEAAEHSLPVGLALAGSAYRGVGVPDCVHQGEQAAERLVGHLLAQQVRAG